MTDAKQTFTEPGPIRWAKRWDWLAARGIRLGGVAILLSMLLLVVFLGKEALPLFTAPEWSLKQLEQTGEGRILGMDPLASMTLEVLSDGTIVASPRTPQGLAGRHEVPWEDWDMDAPSGAFSSLQPLNPEGFGALFMDSGALVPVQVSFKEDFSSGTRKMISRVKFHEPLILEQAPKAWALAMDEEEGLHLVWRRGSTVLRTSYDPEEGLWTEAQTTRLEATGPVAITPSGDLVVAGTANGLVYQQRDKEPFLHNLDHPATSLHFLLGGSILAAGTEGGEVHTLYWLRAVRVMSPKAGSTGELWPETPNLLQGAKEGEVELQPAGNRLFPVRSFQAGNGAVIALASSGRNKGFLSLTDQQDLAFHYATTGRTDLTARLQGDFSSLGFFPKDDGLWVDGPRPVFGDMEQHHPDVTFKNLFFPVWYDGYGGPEQVWQSTGGSDDFEPKLGLWPLIFGTLKGTFYALLISLPLSITGALYLSQLAPRKLKNTLKPAVEFMAALPSVVVGLLGGLWLAPLMEGALVGVLAWLILLPLTIYILFLIFKRLPASIRQRTRNPEMILAPAGILIASFTAWVLSGPIEKGVFKGSLTQWLFETLNITYDQRNCIVVGFALGFAVMPIIFTVCEDAFSAVPGSLTSAALALGANRWQAALKVVVPAASPGVFAAVMLGLGRAVGETMIVLMATGNTPILDWSPFNGMRTMSAAIAVEIPEAPVGSSLYRVLFLAAVILFIMTFVINSLADLVGSRLRKKYGRF